MKIKDVIASLESLAPPPLQENYDNAGLITGDENTECNGILVSLDATEAVIDEAIKKNCNLLISHHPIIFSGLKRITGKNYVQKAVIKAIRNNIALYAIHTNLDNIIDGVNGRIASLLGVENIAILSPKDNQLKKLYTFVPAADADKVRQSIFDAGAGHIGNYNECSFNAEGFGTFKGGMDTDPYVGKPGELHKENELKIEVIFPAWLEHRIIKNLEEAIEDFKNNRTAHIKYIKATSEDLRNHFVQMSFGLLDCYQLCLMISSHTNRHTQQLNEVKTDPGFPK